MGKDADGLIALLTAAGHQVVSTSIPVPAPRLPDMSEGAAAEAMRLYHELGGVQESPSLRPGAWDFMVDGVLVELDEQLHFNRYRAATLNSVSYADLPRFPVEAYRGYCKTWESDCRHAGAAQGRWMNDSTESHFGPSSPRGDLSGNGSSRWKQRALYDFMKDLTQLDASAPPMARIAIWDTIPFERRLTVEAAVHGRPDAAVGEALWELIFHRAGSTG